MDNYIINSFYNKKTNTFEEIKKSIGQYVEDITQDDIKKEMKLLVRKNILMYDNKIYSLTKNGEVVLGDNIFYYSRKIYNFFIKYSKAIKKYEIKEKREEQTKLRDYLIKNKKNCCCICKKILPLCLLETAHLKPRCLLKKNEIYDFNIVEFMCHYCHKLYDDGYIGIKNGFLATSNILKNGQYDLDYIENTEIELLYNNDNKIYFDFHMNFIFKNKN
jgi:hypothetical protein